MAVRTIAPGGGLWNATTTWVEGIVPTNADDVIALANSGNLTINLDNAACRSADFTNGGTVNWAGVLTHNAAINWRIGGTTAGPGNIALKFSAAMTYTRGNSVSSAISFRSGTGPAAQLTIDFAGKSVSGLNFQIITGSNVPSWKLLSAITQTTVSVGINHQRGHLDLGSFTHVFGSYQNSDFTTTRSLTLNASSIELKGSPTPWNVIATGFTLNAGTSTIWSSNTGSANRTFNGGGLVYNNLWISADADSNFTITGNNTFNSILMNRSSSTLLVAAGSVQTFTAGGTGFTLNQAGTMTIRSTVAGTPFTFTKPSGTVQLDNITLIDSTAAGGAIWIATNSVDGGGNTGWNWTVPGTPVKLKTASGVQTKTLRRWNGTTWANEPISVGGP